MDYTIDDLKGKYVEYGTPECDVFLEACSGLEVLVPKYAGVDVKEGAMYMSEHGHSTLIVDSRGVLDGYIYPTHAESNGYTKFTPKVEDPEYQSVSELFQYKFGEIIKKNIEMFNAKVDEEILNYFSKSCGLSREQVLLLSVDIFKSYNVNNYQNGRKIEFCLGKLVLFEVECYYDDTVDKSGYIKVRRYYE